MIKLKNENQGIFKWKKGVFEFDKYSLNNKVKSRNDAFLFVKKKKNIFANKTIYQKTTIDNFIVIFETATSGISNDVSRWMWIFDLKKDVYYVLVIDNLYYWRKKNEILKDFLREV